jgi:CheY-like chemotaxis protein
VLVRHLVALGCIATQAESGYQYLKLATEHCFDLVLMDILMPVMDGLEATRLIKSRVPGLPVVACSASVLEEDRRSALSAGMAQPAPLK